MNTQSPQLLPQQHQALDFVRANANQKSPAARQTIHEVLARAGLAPSAFDAALGSLRANARVDIHFHPERLSRGGQSVAEGLLREGVYKTQYETGLSSGSLTAFAGGERDAWEQRLFGGAYHGPDATLADRPRYGALEVLRQPDGASPRFGSCYFVLRPSVSERCTFTFGGSQEDDALARTGTLETLEPVLAALLREVEQTGGALGAARLTVAETLTQLTAGLAAPFGDPANRPLGHALDRFIEVQVHGTLRLGQDVERLVADPAFRGSQMDELLKGISDKYQLPLHWHPGFRLPTAEVPDTFRGYAVKALAARIAGTGFLDAALLGAAANSLEQDPRAWQEWGDYRDMLTRFRRLWHVLVLYGRPREAAR